MKEGSPYEEDFLLSQLQEEVKILPSDKEEVRDLMKALLNFGLVTESTDIHALVEQTMRAHFAVQGLLTVEQESYIEKVNAVMQVGVREMFAEVFKREKAREE